MKKILMRTWTIFLMLMILCISWTIAYFLTAYMYQKFNIEINMWAQQLITSVLGFLLLFLAMSIIAFFNKHNFARRNEFLTSITDTMQQMATGDFNIRLNKIKAHDNPNDPFGKIVDNINYMAKELGEIENMRQEFISNISHEIQSPLTSISGFANVLKNETLTKEERIHYLSIIEAESKRLSKISDNLLKLTYLESDNHEFMLKEYRLDKQLQHILLACEPQWQEKNIEMELHIEETPLIADEELMNQVWINLINNAIKFTNPGGKVIIQIIKTEHEIKIMITDTGIGITNEEKLHLFERFYKADKARTRHKSGSGLGLSIVKKVLNLHGALIQVESDETGTTFTVIFNEFSTIKGVRQNEGTI